MAVLTKISKKGVWLLLGVFGVAGAQSAACSPRFHSCRETYTCRAEPQDEAGAAGDEAGGASGGLDHTIAGASGSGPAGAGGLAAEAGAGGFDGVAGSSSGGVGGTDSGSTDSGGTDSGGNDSGGKGGSGAASGGPVGASCSANGDCALGNCIDGVCCEGVCSGCRACAAALTGKSDGTCAPVVSGQDPHNQCDGVSATSQCGNDGACDGAGACRKVTTCDDGNACTVSDSCQSGTCTGTPKVCPAATPCKFASACAAGSCSAQQNFPDGSADPTCAAGKPYCFSGACVACNADSQCGLPTPSCSNHACVCRQPSATNKLKNPGFDGTASTGFTSWVTPTHGKLAADSEGCPGSNGVFVETTEWDPTQCFPLTPGNYFLGGTFKGPPTGSFVRVHFYTAADCKAIMNGYTADLRLDNITVDWKQYWASITAPPGTVSADVGIYGIQLYADQLFVGTTAQF